jgi:hypothetical protein
MPTQLVVLAPAVRSVSQIRKAKSGFGCTMNKMGSGIIIDPRAFDAVYASL